MSKAMSKTGETILGGFDSDSESDSEFSETWSELGEQIFSIPDEDPDQNGQDPNKELDDQIYDEYDPPSADQMDTYDDDVDEKPPLDFKFEDYCDEQALLNDQNFNKNDIVQQLISSTTSEDLKPHVNLLPEVDYIKPKQRRPRRARIGRPRKRIKPSIVCELCHQRFRFVTDYEYHNNPQVYPNSKYKCVPRPRPIQSTTPIFSQDKKVYIAKKPKIEVTVPIIHEKNLRPRSSPCEVEERVEHPHLCDICHRRFFQNKFLTMHREKHYAPLTLRGDKLKCINLDCHFTTRTRLAFKKHVNICEFSLKTREENEKRHQVSPIDCVFLSCTTGFLNPAGFFDHLESIHEVLCNRNIKGFSGGEVIPKCVKETPKQKARRLAKQRERAQRLLLNHKSSSKKSLIYDATEKKAQNVAKKRENDRARLRNETEEQRTRRINRQKEYNRRRLTRETDEERSQRLAIIRENSRRRYLGVEPNSNGKTNKGSTSTFSENDTFSCDKCSLVFPRKCELTVHSKNVHPESYFENGKYICEICGKAFQYSYYLQLHSRIHGEKIYKCPHENCSKSYAIEYQLKMHIRSQSAHTRTTNSNDKNKKKTTSTTTSGSSTHRLLCEKIHLCELCGAGFSRQRDYLNHGKEHSRLLTLRKEAYESKMRCENPLKSDQEILGILDKFWESRESLELRSAPETCREKKARCRLRYIEEINKKGLKLWNESIDECLERLRKERLEVKQRKREGETEEEKAERRKKCRISVKNYVTNNRERYLQWSREYQKKKWEKRKKENKPADPEAKAKLLAYYRDRWAKKTPEQKAQRLESMRNYQKRRKKNSVD